MTMMQRQVREGVGYLQDTLPETPKVGLVLGSGLGSIATEITEPIFIPYASIPSMKVSTALGHEGRFVCGLLEGVYVICMQGRLHLYEGYSAADIAFPIYLMGELGVRDLILTNASGGINTSYEVGDIVLVDDHINLTGTNPLVGVHGPNGIVPTPDMTQAYSVALAKLAKHVADDREIPLKEGVYAGVLGPSFETPAEIRALHALGADLVGMSTVHEVIAASQMGMDVLLLSLITNMAAGILDQPISVDEVSRIGESKALMFCSLVHGILAGI